MEPIKEIRAQAFVLVDENNTPQGQLAMKPEGPALEILSADGKGVVASLSRRGLQSELALFHDDGTMRLMIYVDEDKQPTVVFFDDNAERVALCLGKDGKLYGVQWDAEGVPQSVQAALPKAPDKPQNPMADYLGHLN